MQKNRTFYLSAFDRIKYRSSDINIEEGIEISVPFSNTIKGFGLEQWCEAAETIQNLQSGHLNLFIYELFLDFVYRRKCSSTPVSRHFIIQSRKGKKNGGMECHKSFTIFLSFFL